MSYLLNPDGKVLFEVVEPENTSPEVFSFAGVFKFIDADAHDCYSIALDLVDKAFLDYEKRAEKAYEIGRARRRLKVHPAKDDKFLKDWFVFEVGNYLFSRKSEQLRLSKDESRILNQTKGKLISLVRKLHEFGVREADIANTFLSCLQTEVGIKYLFLKRKYEGVFVSYNGFDFDELSFKRKEGKKAKSIDDLPLRVLETKLKTILKINGYDVYPLIVDAIYKCEANSPLRVPPISDDQVGKEIADTIRRRSDILSSREKIDWLSRVLKNVGAIPASKRTKSMKVLYKYVLKNDRYLYPTHYSAKVNHFKVKRSPSVSAEELKLKYLRNFCSENGIT